MIGKGEMCVSEILQAQSGWWMACILCAMRSIDMSAKNYVAGEKINLEDA